MSASQKAPLSQPDPSGEVGQIARLQGEKAELEAIVLALRAELDHKSELLREVNHRAKNNLQMAMAMLCMQALATDDSSIAKALNAASQRLGYLARLHEMLYRRGDDLQEIEMSEFLSEIAVSIQQGFGRPDIRLDLQLTQAALSVPQATNAALFAGEALLNAFKYAFPGRPGRIELSFRPDGDAAVLRVTDDGVGFPLAERRGSLGMRLLRALARAMGGEAEVCGEGGVTVAVTFECERPSLTRSS